MNELQFNSLLRKIWENNFPVEPPKNYNSSYSWLKCIKTRKVFQIYNSFENEEEFENWIKPQLKNLFGPKIVLPKQKILPVDILFMKNKVLHLIELKYCKNSFPMSIMGNAINQLQSYRNALVSFFDFFDIKIKIKCILLISYLTQNKRFVHIIDIDIDKSKKTLYELNKKRTWNKIKKFVITLPKNIL